VSPAWPVDQAYVARAHARNLKVVPYTINRGVDVAWAASVGVDAVITDDPLMALKTLDGRPAAVTLKPLSRKLARVRRKRRVRVEVASQEPVTVDLFARFKRKTIGRLRLALDSAGRRKVAIRINRAGRKRLADRDTAKLKLVAKTTDIALNRGKARARARLG
jgi:hypothetical protein